MKLLHIAIAIIPIALLAQDSMAITLVFKNTTDEELVVMPHGKRRLLKTERNMMSGKKKFGVFGEWLEPVFHEIDPKLHRIKISHAGRLRPLENAEHLKKITVEPGNTIELDFNDADDLLTCFVPDKFEIGYKDKETGEWDWQSSTIVHFIKTKTQKGQSFAQALSTMQNAFDSLGENAGEAIDNAIEKYLKAKKPSSGEDEDEELEEIEIAPAAAAALISVIPEALKTLGNTLIAATQALHEPYCATLNLTAIEFDPNVMKKLIKRVPKELQRIMLITTK